MADTPEQSGIPSVASNYADLIKSNNSSQQPVADPNSILSYLPKNYNTDSSETNTNTDDVSNPKPTNDRQVNIPTQNLPSTQWGKSGLELRNETVLAKPNPNAVYTNWQVEAEKAKAEKDKKTNTLTAYKLETSDDAATKVTNLFSDQDVPAHVQMAHDIKMGMIFGKDWQQVDEETRKLMLQDTPEANRILSAKTEETIKNFKNAIKDPESREAKAIADPTFLMRHGETIAREFLLAEKNGTEREYWYAKLANNPVSLYAWITWCNAHDSERKQIIDSTLGSQSWSQWASALFHGGLTAAKTHVAKGLWSRLEGAYETINKSDKFIKDKNDSVKDSYQYVLQEFKNGNYPKEEQSIVEQLSHENETNKDKFLTELYQTNSKTNQLISKLGPVARFDLSLRFKHKVYTPKATYPRKASNELRYRNPINTDVENPIEADRPMTIFDLNLDAIKDGKIDFNDATSVSDVAATRLKLAEQGDTGLEFFLHFPEDPKRKELDDKYGKEKINPALFYLDNLGSGAFGKGVDSLTGYIGSSGALTYNTVVSPTEQLATGGYSLGTGILLYNTRPNSFFYNAKRYTQLDFSTEAQMGFIAASFESKFKAEDMAKGDYHPIADTVGAVAEGISKFQGQDSLDKTKLAGATLRQNMINYGFATESTAELGMMRVNPVMYAGRFSALGSSALRKSMSWMTDKELITEKTLEKVVKGTEWVADKAMAAPVRVAAFTIGYGGRALVLLTGGAVKWVAKIGGKGAVALGWAKEGMAAENIIKKSLTYIGVTDAFLTGGMSRKFAMAFGLGKIAEAGGLTFGQYFNLKVGGYGFRGAAATAAMDASLPNMARRIASSVQDMGVVGTATWDVCKGMYTGAGVGFSLEFMKGDWHDGWNGVSGGMGMGGVSSGLHSIHAYWTGESHATIAREMIEARTELLDPELKIKLLHNLNEAHKSGDYEYATGLIGAMERIAGFGGKMVLTDDAGVAKNPLLRQDILRLADSDFTIGGKTFRVREIRQATNEARQRLNEVRNNDKLTPDEKARQISELRKTIATGDLEYHTEVKDYLDAVDKSDNEDLKERVKKSAPSFRGVHIVDNEGQQFVFLNLDQMTSSTSSHELYHTIKSHIAKEMVSRHIASVMMGIKLRSNDAQGNPTEATYQKGLFDANDIREFAKIYYTRLHSEDPARRDAKIAEINKAADELELVGDKGVISHESARKLTKMAEEFGASWFEQFVKRNPLDAMYRGNKYGKIQTLINRAEMYIKHNTILDANADGIKENIRRESAKAEKDQIALNKRSELLDKFNKLVNLYLNAKENGASKETLAAYESKISEHKKEFEKLTKQGWTANADNIFYSEDGSHLIVPEMERHLTEILGMEGDSRGGSSATLDLNGMSGSVLDAHLKSLGLEHWGYVDNSGVVRLKDQNQIQQEALKRGEKIFEEIKKMDPKVSGVVITTDAHGNLRMVGSLTDQAIQILTGQIIDFDGRQEPLMLPSEALKYQMIRDAVKNGFNEPNSPKGNNVTQFLYSALSVQKYGPNGEVITSRRPKNEVEQTFRRVLPYRLEYVLTTKDRDGNKVKPHFEAMVTAVDLNVLYRRMANEFNGTYTLPSGTVVKVSELFGDMTGMHNAVSLYLQNLSNNNPEPSAEIFGGGELGAAKRDIMHKVLGTIPHGGMDMNGKPMYKNNPMIRPFQVAERGPDFAFTTFRLDLMSNLETLNQRVPFTDETYQRSQVNYQPPVEQGTLTVKGVNGDIKTTKLKGTIQTKNEGIIDTDYDLVESAGRYFVRSIHNQNEKEVSFASRKQALDYINLSHNILQAKLTNALESTINYKLNGYVVSYIDGKYVILDAFKKGKDKASYAQVGTKTYTSFADAIRDSANMHNERLKQSLRDDMSIPEKDKKVLLSQIDNIKSVSPEALPPRLEIGDDGLPAYEQKKNDDDEPVYYTAKDDLVKAGVVKVGDPVYKIKLQKVDYNLTKLMTGRKSLLATDPSLKKAASKFKKHMVNFILDSITNPDIARGYSWYRDFSTRGYEVFGGMFPIFCEALGATSARTNVESNFKQAIEFMHLYSTGHYDKKIGKIIERLNNYYDLRNALPQEGQELNDWHRNHLLRFRGDAAYKALLKEYKFKKSYTLDMFMANDSSIPQNLRDNFNELFTDKLNRGPKLTDNQLAEIIDREEKEILNADETLLLRAGDKKYNMNTNKVTMVAVSKFFDKSDGPKTPQFARNLMGRNMDATIDVWAMRTLHRIANTLINKNDIWRIPAAQEMGVDGEYINTGTLNMPKYVGRGDFFLGQEVFKQVVRELKSKHGDKFDGKFINMTPADLQALAWFAEKHLYDQNNWTDNMGAAKSSFEDPLYRISGEVSDTNENRFSHISRLLVGLSAENNTVRTIFPEDGAKQEEGIRIRSSAAPVIVQQRLQSNLRDAYGKKILALNVKPTLGIYGTTGEYSIHVETTLERGNNITISNELADVKRLIGNANDLLRSYAVELSNASPQEVGAIENKLKSKRKDLEVLNKQLFDLNNKYESENSTPIYSNQFAHLLDTVINYGKQYQQESVLAHEVVNSSHPNARPARQVLFKRPLSGFEANKLVQRILKNNERLGFTLIPEPNNPNNGKIESLSRTIDSIQNQMRDPKLSKTKRNALQSNINRLNRDILKLMKFTGMYNVCVPEFASATDGNSARAIMETYEKNADETLKKVLEGNKDILGVNNFHTNTVAVNTGGYDTTNIAESGSEADLDFHVKRYKQSYERYERQKQEIASGSPVGDHAGAVWTNDTTSRGSILNGPATDGINATGQEASRSPTFGRYNQADARDWLAVRKESITEMAGGRMYGDGDITITQLRGNDGKLTNQYQVHDKEARRTMKFVGQEAAEKYTIDRLTGSVQPDAAPRTIERGGKIYEVIESAVAVPERKGLPANPERGVYAQGEPILDFQPSEEERSKLERITDEEKQMYYDTLAAGDMDQLKAVVLKIAKRLGFEEYYRGGSGRRDYRTFKEGRQSRIVPEKNAGLNGSAAYVNNLKFVGPIEAWLSTDESIAASFAAGAAKARQTETGTIHPQYPLGRIWNVGVDTSGYFDPRNSKHIAKIRKAIREFSPHEIKVEIGPRRTITNESGDTNFPASWEKVTVRLRAAAHPDRMTEENKEWMIKRIMDLQGVTREAAEDAVINSHYHNYKEEYLDTNGKTDAEIKAEAEALREAYLEDKKQEWQELLTDSLRKVGRTGNFRQYETHKAMLADLIQRAGFTGQYEKENDLPFARKNDKSAPFQRQLLNIGSYDTRQIKSLDPVTYDENGKPIPIEQRFDRTIDDINYQPLRGLVRENESPLSGKKIVLDETIGGRINLLHHKVLTLPKDKNKGMPLIMRMLKPESTWSRNREYAPVFGDINTFITTYENLTGKDFYKSFRDIQINRGVGLLDVRNGVLPSMVHEVATKLFEHLSARLKADPKNRISNDTPENQQWIERTLIPAIEYLANRSIRTDLKLNDGLTEPRVVDAIRNILMGDMTKAGVSEESKNAFDEQMQNAFDLFDKRGDRYDRWKRKFASTEEANVSLAKTFEAIKQIDPKIYSLIQLSGLVEKYDIRSGNDWQNRNSQVNLENLQAASSEIQLTSTSSTLHSHMLKELMAKHGVDLTESEKKILDISGWSRVKGHAREAWAGATDSLEASSTNFNPDLNKDYLKKLYEEGYIKEEHYASLLSLHETNPNLDLGITSRSANATTALLGFIQGLSNQRLALTSGKRSELDNGTFPPNDWAEWARYHGGGNFGIQSEKDFNKVVRDLTSLKDKLTEIYNGKDKVVLKKRLPYDEVIKNRIASGELKTMGETFEELRSYGINKISVVQMMKLAKLTTDTLPINLEALDTDVANTTQSDRTDFQLLSLVHAFSGLNFERHDNTVWAATEGSRGWARSERESIVQNPNEYLMKTDGDSRTMLEELHHSLMGQNRFYKMLNSVEHISHGSGAEFRTAFEKRIAELESELEGRKNDLLLRDNPNANESSIIGTDRRNIRDTDKNNNTNFGEDIDRLEQASQIIGDTALLTIAKLYIKSFDTNLSNFGFSGTVGETGNPNNEPASAHTFSNVSRSVKIPSAKDARFLGEYRWYGDKTLLSKRDYGFKNLIEFAAHALNDRHVQSVLLQMEPVTVNGEEPVNKVIKDLGTSNNPKVKSYVESLRSMFAKATNALQQVYLVLKQLVRFRQSSNHSNQGAFSMKSGNDTYAQKFAADNAETLKTKRTALEQAIEAGALVRPRFHESRLDLVGGQNKPLAKGLDIRNQMNYGNHLDYLGRVQKGESK